MKALSPNRMESIARIPFGQTIIMANIITVAHHRQKQIISNRVLAFMSHIYPLSVRMSMINCLECRQHALIEGHDGKTTT